MALLLYYCTYIIKCNVNIVTILYFIPSAPLHTIHVNPSSHCFSITESDTEEQAKLVDILVLYHQDLQSFTYKDPEALLNYCKSYRDEAM